MDDFKSTAKMQCFKEGGSVKYKSRHSEKSEMSEDIAQDKKVVKKAFAMHDKQEHPGKKTDLSKLRKGGRAKKEIGTAKKFMKAPNAPSAAVKAYKTGGNVSNVYEAKKDSGDKDSIRKVKNIKPKMLCGGKSVQTYNEGKMVKQAGATEAQQKYYQKNMEEADKKTNKALYEAIGSRGNAARKGMEEGRVDQMGNVYDKGGKVAKKC